jgi:DNA-binding response OmpR family regulator
VGHKVLNVTADPELGSLRAQVMQSGGYEVVSAANIIEVEQACELHSFDAIVIGHTIPVKEKRRISAILRERCKPTTPIIAVYAESPEEADDVALAVSAHHPQALLDALNSVLSTKYDRHWGK